MTVKVTKPAINLREELADLRKPTGIAGEAMLRAETPQEQFQLIGAGRRNLVINGDFQVSQRGDFTTASSAVNQEYFVDRWFTDVGTVNFTKEQTTGIDIDGLPAISKGVKLTATASGTSYMGIRQKIENPTQYIGRTFTHSAWVKSNNSNARLSSFISGSTAQTVVGNSHSGSGQWEKLSVTFTITGNPNTAWYVDAFVVSEFFNNTTISSGDYIEVTNIQLELGKVATPFEHRSYGEELALCQRYFETVKDNKDMICVATSFSDQAAYGSIDYKVEKRATPTITFVGGASNYRYRTEGNNRTLTSIGVSSVNDQNFRIDIGVGVGNTTSGYSGWLSENTGATGMHIDAEL